MNLKHSSPKGFWCNERNPVVKFSIVTGSGSPSWSLSETFTKWMKNRRNLNLGNIIYQIFYFVQWIFAIFIFYENQQCFRFLKGNCLTPESVEYLIFNFRDAILCHLIRNVIISGKPGPVVQYKRRGHSGSTWRWSMGDQFLIGLHRRRLQLGLRPGRQSSQSKLKTRVLRWHCYGRGSIHFCCTKFTYCGMVPQPTELSG